MRTHKAARQLAMMLAKAGYHLLRFDYSGTGDSAGAGEDVTIAQWLEDIATAADELKETSGVSRIPFVGLRLEPRSPDRRPQREPTWTIPRRGIPVVVAERYVDELMAAPFSDPGPAGTKDPRATLGAAGFPVSPALRAGFADMDFVADAAQLATTRRARDITRARGLHAPQTTPGGATTAKLPASTGAEPRALD